MEKQQAPFEINKCSMQDFLTLSLLSPEDVELQIWYEKQKQQELKSEK